MPDGRWRAVVARAQDRHQSDATKVFNALAESFLAGELDAVVAAWLPRVSPGGDRHPASELAGAATG